MQARPTAVLASMLLCLLVLVAPAQAAFPGQNGDIAYSKFSPRSESARIFTMNPDGSEQTLLGPGSSPSYSPDGTRIVYEDLSGTGEEAFNQDIYVVDAEGAPPTRCR